MSTANVIELYPAQTVETLAAEFLRAKRDAAAAEARVKALAPKLLAALQTEGQKGAAVSGLGSVSIVAASTRTTTDMRAVREILSQRGIPEPLSTSDVAPSLRASLI